MDKPTNVGRGPNIPPEIEKKLISIYLDDTRKKSKEIMSELHRYLKENNMDTVPDWPGLSIIQRKLGEYRKKNNERKEDSKELDKPWTISAMSKHVIPAEALPYILQVWFYYQTVLIYDQLFAPFQPFSIRMALWVSRLYSVVRNINDPKEIEHLAEWARDYANDEVALELEDTGPFLSVKEFEIYEKILGENILDNEYLFPEVTKGYKLDADIVERTRNRKL